MNHYDKVKKISDEFAEKHARKADEAYMPNQEQQKGWEAKVDEVTETLHNTKYVEASIVKEIISEQIEEIKKWVEENTREDITGLIISYEDFREFIKKLS